MRVCPAARPCAPQHATVQADPLSELPPPPAAAAAAAAAEKSVAEYRDRLPQNVIDEINGAVADLRGVMESENPEASLGWSLPCASSASQCVGWVWSLLLDGAAAWLAGHE